MARKKTTTIGDEVASQLFEAIQLATTAPLAGARQLPVLKGIGPRQSFIEPQENVLIGASSILADSERIYTYGNQVAFETKAFDGSGAALVALRTGCTTETGAEDFLANIMLCQIGDQQVPFPKWFSDLLLRSELLPDRLPRIRHYAMRPVFDPNFILNGPGWHPAFGILVHGPHVEPVAYTAGDPAKPAMERLPHHLETLLRGFCFRSDADLANALGMMLTGVLSNHFVTEGKALCLFDGNQSGIGKTLLVRAIGVVLDGFDPELIHYTPDDTELAKELCAQLRKGRQSIVLIDNAKVVSGSAINSPCIEANSTAPAVNLRILGKSEMYTRPNDLLWVITMNDTRITSDGVDRALPIRLALDGRPADRKFDGPDPIKYAREHRVDILGELTGMVIYWIQQGRPMGSQSHRLQHWGLVISGILDTGGFPEFLTNVQEAAATFNTALDALAALAEAVIEADLNSNDEDT